MPKTNKSDTQPQTCPTDGSLSLGSYVRLVLCFLCATEVEHYSHFFASYIEISK